jgi:phage tail-like protein
MKRSEIEPLLPAVFQRTLYAGSPLGALLDVMEALHAPAEGVLARLETHFDPARAPDRFVPLLARWVDLAWLLAADPGAPAAGRDPDVGGTARLRELVAAAAYLSQWRGTAHGLLRFLEIATGVPGFGVEEQTRPPDGRMRPYHIRVLVPPAAMAHAALIERIVAMEKPAYVTHELVAGSVSPAG